MHNCLIPVVGCNLPLDQLIFFHSSGTVYSFTWLSVLSSAHVTRLQRFLEEQILDELWRSKKKKTNQSESITKAFTKPHSQAY